MESNRYRYIDESREHLHTLDGRPLIGTSTAMKILNKPLTWWASGMAVGRLGWTNSKIKVNGKYKAVSIHERIRSAEPMLEAVKKMSVEEYITTLDEAYAAHNTRKEQAADDGSARHEQLEAYVKSCINGFEGVPQELSSEDKSVQAFVEWARKNIKKFLWSEMHCYSEQLWTGGIADVGWESSEGKIVAADFKSSKESYFDQWLQVAGYDIELTENGGFTADGENIFKLERPIELHCIVPFGSYSSTSPLTVEFNQNVEKYREGFRSAVHLYKLSQLFSQVNY